MLDVTTAALALGCSERHVRDLVYRGTFTNIGTPRRIRLAYSEVEDECVRRLDNLAPCR